MTRRDEHARTRQIVGLRNHAGADLVVAEYLDRPFGAAGRRRHEQDRRFARPGGADRLDPIADSPVILHDGHGRNMRAPAPVVVVEGELTDAARRTQPHRERVPRRGDCVQWRRVPVPCLGRLGRSSPLIFERPPPFDHVVQFEDDAGGAGAAHVVDNRRGAIGFQRIVRVCLVREQFALGSDDELIHRGKRPLRRRVVPADRVDDVADEFEPERLRFRSGVHVNDTAADEELAVLIHRIFSGESGHRQSVADLLRGDLGSDPKRQAGGREAFDVTQARQERPRRRDDRDRRSSTPARGARARGPKPLPDAD